MVTSSPLVVAGIVVTVVPGMCLRAAFVPGLAVTFAVLAAAAMHCTSPIAKHTVLLNSAVHKYR